MEQMLSPVWGSVADLRPTLSPHVRSIRQSFRGNVWYVLQDGTSARFHRFSSVAHYLIVNMDGQHSLQRLWDMALERWGDAAPSQTEVIRLLGQLYQQDLVRCDMSVDVQSLLARSERKAKLTRRQKFMSPLSIRIPVLDPDAFLERTQHLVKPLYSTVGFLLWAAIVAFGLILAAMNWPELTGNLADRVFAPDNLVVMLVLYPIVKFFHELGHAYAVKRWGGEVHDIGVLFLVFMPVPYVDATAASAFRDKRKRMLVGAAGIMVELVFASIAMFVWTEAQPGLLRSVAFNVMLIGGVSTLFFNGNPLLRFDGYYVFSDALEIPNLAPRSTQFLGYLVQRYILRSKTAEMPVATAGEKRWFVVYGISAFVYRLFIMFTIVMFVAGQWYFIGVLLALWAVNAMLVMPLWRKAKFLFSSPVLRENRTQAVTIAGSVLVGLILLFSVLPFPSYTVAEGVVWVSESAEIRAAGDGVLTKIYQGSETEVETGQALFKMDDPLLIARKRVLESRLSELNANFQSQLRENPGQAQIIRARYNTVASQLEHVNEQTLAQTIVSSHDGTLLISDPDSMTGRFYRQGDLLAYVVNYPVGKAIAVVQQDYIGQVRQKVEGIELRFASDFEQTWPVTILREIPASTQKLPSSALGDQGGGRIKTDPSSQDATQAFDPFFQYEVALPEGADARYVGERVYLRFHHGSETLAVQVWRVGRRAFLKRFGV